MLLSIIIPVYNGEKKIERCLESVSYIKDFDIEFIIVNDGSTDCTKEICEKYVKKDSRYCLINQENGGVSKARNTGLKCCKGKYVTFIDADDEILEDYRKIIEIVRKEDSCLYSFDYLMKKPCDIITRSRGYCNSGKNERQALLNNYLAMQSNNVWSNIYSNVIIRKYGIKFPENMKMGEDAIFNADFFQHCQEVYYINEVGYKYYRDDLNSAMYAYKASYLKDYVAIHEKYMEIYNSEAGLTYPFRGNYYLENVFNIANRDGRNIKKIDKKKFRKSDFFRRLMTHKFYGWKRKLKKWYIRCCMYL